MNTSFAILAQLLAEKFGVALDTITEDKNINELGLDSLTLMEFIFAAEDAFSLRIPEDRLNPHQAGLTLREVCKVIDELSAAKNSGAR